MQDSSSDSTHDLDFLPFSRKDSMKWDIEWLRYFVKPSSDVYLKRYKDVPVPDIASMTREQVWDVLRIWADGSDMVGRQILEIGCGMGYLGKQLGQVAKLYLGVDHSPMALYIAHLVSPESCNYSTMDDLGRITKYKGSMDIMVGREFFIHQNWSNAVIVLKLAHYLLIPGGLACLDFYLSDDSVSQGFVYPSKHPGDARHPSSGYVFTVEEINELATICGFDVVDVVDRQQSLRRLVTLRKQVAKAAEQKNEEKKHNEHEIGKNLYPFSWLTLLILIVMLLLMRRTKAVKDLLNLIL